MMIKLAGAALGITAGFLVFAALKKCVTYAMRNQQRRLWLLAFQFLLIPAVLVPVAFITPDQLLWAGVFMSLTLILCAFIHIFRHKRK